MAGLGRPYCSFCEALMDSLGCATCVRGSRTRSLCSKVKQGKDAKTTKNSTRALDTELLHHGLI